MAAPSQGSGAAFSQAPDVLTITRPDDWHLHVRDGDMMAAVLPHTAATFGRAIIMPNLQPPVTEVEQVRLSDSTKKPPDTTKWCSLQTYTMCQRCCRCSNLADLEMAVSCMPLCIKPSPWWLISRL